MNLRKISIFVVITLTATMLLSYSPVSAEVTKSAIDGQQLTPVRNSCPSSRITNQKENYIVRFSDSATEADVTRLINLKNGKQKGRFKKAFNGAIVEMSPKDATELCLLNDASLRWVEEDRSLKVDPLMAATVRATTAVAAASWGIDRVDQRSGTDGFYSYVTDGAGVDVYVVDTGLTSAHSEFAGRVKPGYSSITGDANTTDCNGHGTHVAGTAVGATFGVAPRAFVVPVQAMDCNGAGSLSSVLTGIDWVIENHVSTPAVMNLSIGSDRSESLNAAIDRAFLDGITVVVAAGNDATNACLKSPASSVSSALTVGATTNTDARAYFSNYGECLDVFAPGFAITSAWHTTPGVTTLSGTSMASPHVAGLAARYLSVAPAAHPMQVMAAVIDDATPNVVADAGPLSPNRLAFGDPDVIPLPPPAMAPTNPDAIAAPPGSGTPTSPSLPGQPTRPVPLSGVQSSWLRWKETADGGLPITGHVVEVFRQGKLVGRVVVDADELHTIAGLRAQTAHTFRVAAMNALGIGPFSPVSKPVIPLKTTRVFKATHSSSVTGVVPNKPTRVRIQRNRTSVDVRWSVPKNATVSGYEVLFIQKKKVLAKAITNAVGGVRISGLKPGRYNVQVVAVNEAGVSKRSKAVSLTFR